MPLSRNLNGARDAFANQDVELSKFHHSGLSERNNESSNRLARNVIVAALDGVALSFALLCAVVGARFSSGVVIVLGITLQLCSALSMGVRNYLSQDAEIQYIKRERKREEWELENHPEGEKKEMVEIYIDKGFSEQDAENVIGTMAKYSDFFIDHMLVQELGLLPPEFAENPARNGLITSLSYALFGALPLICFLSLDQISWPSTNGSFAITAAASSLTVLVLGIYKSKYAREKSWLKRSLLVLANFGLTAVCSFLLSWGLSEIVHVRCQTN